MRPAHRAPRRRFIDSGYTKRRHRSPARHRDPPRWEPAFFPMLQPAADGQSSPAFGGQRRGPWRQGGARVVSGEASQTIRVDLDRVDHLINLVGELVINGAMLSQRIGQPIAQTHQSDGVASALEALETPDPRASGQRHGYPPPQPVRSVFQRMPRLVREVAAQVGKSVAAGDRRRGLRGRQDRHRAPVRPTGPHDPQRDRPWTGEPARTDRRRQAAGRRGPAIRSPSVGPGGHRGRRRRPRHRPPPACAPLQRTKASSNPAPP